MPRYTGSEGSHSAFTHQQQCTLYILLCVEDWAEIYGACGCGGPISICLTQHRLAHQLGSSLLLQEDPVVDLPILVDRLTYIS